MLIIRPVITPKDFAAADALCRALGDWDATTHAANGIEPELVLGLYHRQTADSLARRFSGPNAAILLAEWDTAPAGCVAVESVGPTAGEIHKFYVDPAFRRRGIGGALIQSAIAAIAEMPRRRIVIHTSRLMVEAIAVYTAFGFERCAPFRSVPDVLVDIEIFLQREV